MSLDGAFFPPAFLWLATLLLGAALVLAVRLAPWRRLRAPEQLHVFLGTTVSLVVLWHLEAPLAPGFSFHILGLTAVTLMLGWSFAVIASVLALVGVTLNGGGDWAGLGLNGLVSGVFPITLTQILLILIRSFLPKNFFVYVLANGFATAGVASVATGFLAAWILAASGASSFALLEQRVLPFFPLMFLPEANLNGWLLTVLVAFKPRWVYSFSDEQYIHGK